MHRLLSGDVFLALDRIDNGSVDAVTTSVPYWGLRDYGHGLQIGDEPLHEYLCTLGQVFDMIVPKLSPGALVWLNIGDTCVGSGGAGGDYITGSRKSRPKYRQPAATVRCDWRDDVHDDVVELADGQWAGVPSRLAHELQARGWLLRADVVWVKDTPQRHDIGHVRRPKEQHEHVLMLSRVTAGDSRFESSDQRLGDVWCIGAARGVEATGKAPWPVALPYKMLRLSGERGVVLDPFVGHGNTYHAAGRAGWDCIGIDADPDACDAVRRRFRIDPEVVS